MHEMSLCEGIRRVVDQASAAPDIAKVTRVRLEIGRFAAADSVYRADVYDRRLAGGLELKNR